MKPFPQNPHQDNKTIISAISDAISIIHSSQDREGGFASLSGNSFSDFSGGFSGAPSWHTTFIASTILHCLISVNEAAGDCLPPALRKTAGFIADRTAEFLITERGPRWSFNYLSRRAKSGPGLPFYPDDLDDTFVALAALQRSRHPALSGAAVADAAKLLIAQEIRAGGPYRTWIVPPQKDHAPDGPDPVVNANIAYFLALRNVHLAGLDGYLSSCIGHNGIAASAYYPDPFPFAYALSRYHAADARTGIAARKTLEGFLTDAGGRILRGEEPGNLLRISMIASSLLRSGSAHPECLQDLCSAILADVRTCGWIPIPFCIDPSRNGARCYAGASALTAAFAAEALSYFLHDSRCTDIGSSSTDSSPSFHNQMRDEALRACNFPDISFRDLFAQKIAKAADPFITEHLLDLERIVLQTGCRIPERTASRLALAGLYGWVAYDIYDDLLDGEAAMTLLPVANILFSKMMELYASFRSSATGIENRDILAILIRHLEATAAFQFREVAATVRSIPQVMTSRGSGYAAGALAMLALAGFPEDSRASMEVKSFLEHYLAARQLHDDVRDWEDDLVHQRTTEVTGSLMIRYAKHCSGDAVPRDTLLPSGPAALPQLRILFRNEVLDGMEARIRMHIGHARRVREASAILHGSDFLENRLSLLERDAAGALVERDRIREFLDAF